MNKTMIAVALAAAGCSFAEPEVDQGGLTFDFRAISAKRFASGNATKLDASAWKGGYCFMHNSDIAGNDPRRQAVKKAVEYRVDGETLTIVKKPELVAISGGEAIAANVSGGMSQTVKLGNADGGVYHVTVTYRMRHDLGTFGGILVTPIVARNGLPKGETAPGDIAPELRVCDFCDITSDWLTWAKDFRVPKGCDALNLVMRIDGVGELSFKDASVSRVRIDDEISLRIQQADWLDGTFAFSEGQCGMPAWMWKKNDPAKKYAVSRFTYVLTLPKGYTYVESIMGIPGKETRKVLPDGSTEIRIPGRSYGAVGMEYGGWPLMSALIRADAGAQPGEMRFCAEYEGRRVTGVTVTKVFTIPAIRAKVPARYANGIYLGGPYAHFQTAAGREGFAELFSAAGANWIVQMRPDEETMKVWRAHGVRYVTPEWAHCANGFHVGDPALRPESDKYVALPGGTHREIGNGVCPISVYGESPFFRTNTLPRLKQFLAGSDGLWSNWEPYMFAGRGCMCARCRAAFAKYAGVSDAEMAKDWPRELAYGHKWYDKVRRFRSLEHAKLIKTIDKYVTAYTGGRNSVGFIPGVALSEMSSGWRVGPRAAEVQPYDYAGSLKWIDPWGPYPWWDADTPYGHLEGHLLRYFSAAKDARAQIDKDHGGNAPKLMAFPHGLQGHAFITEPESIALSCDAFFFNRWESTVIYAFPKGYDARYWQAFADATSRAAQYENYVFDGRRCDDEVAVKRDPSKPFPPPRAKGPGHASEADRSLLQHVAYELDGKALVAVFNFAEKDVAYVTISVPGKGSRRVTVGASRCRTFLFE